jgi:hypothetical protein
VTHLEALQHVLDFREYLFKKLGAAEILEAFVAAEFFEVRIEIVVEGNGRHGFGFESEIALRIKR